MRTHAYLGFDLKEIQLTCVWTGLHCSVSAAEANTADADTVSLQVIDTDSSQNKF